MKNSFFWFVLFVMGLTHTTYAQDTITIDVNNRAKIMIIAKDKEALEALRRIDINTIVREAMESIDSTELAKNKTQVFEYDLGADGWELNIRKQIDREIEASNGKINQTTINIFGGNTEKLSNSRSSNFFALDFGFNNYLENGNIPNADNRYGVSPLGSRYFGLGWHKRWRVGGQNSPLRFQIGAELTWYNFVFTNNNYATMREVNNVKTLEFRDYQTDFQKGLSKSKLTVTYLNVPFNVHLRFRKSKENNSTAFRIGVGGYVGYRLDAYSKRKFDSRPERERSQFFLNDFRYGYEATFGFNDELMFYFRQDLNSLFVTDANRPDLKPFTVGIKWYID